jgi:hypothetical protein
LTYNIDVFHLNSTHLQSLIEKLKFEETDEFNFSYYEIEEYQNGEDFSPNEILIFEEESSYFDDFAQFEKIISKYKISPVIFIISNNKEIVNVVRWMRKGVYDYILNNDFKKVFIDSIKEIIKSEKNEDKKQKDDLLIKNYMEGRIVISRNNDWEILQENQFYDFTLVRISISMTKDYLGRYSKSSIEKIYETIKNEVAGISQNFGGKIWYWQNNSGIIIFHFGNYTNCAVLSGIYFMNFFFLMCFKKLNLDEMLKFKISIHNGNSLYRKTSIEHISSDTINSIVHLDNYFTKEDNLFITEPVYKNLSVRLINNFEHAGEYEGRQIYRYNPIGPV